MTEDPIGAYRRIESGEGTIDDLFKCAGQVYDKVVSAAECSISKKYTGRDLMLDRMNCRPDRILAAAKLALGNKLMPTEEGIFRASEHFDRYTKNLVYLTGLLEEATQEYQIGFKPKLDIRKSPRHTSRAEKGSLKRLEQLKEALTGLNLPTDGLCSPEKIRSIVKNIDEAYKFKSGAHGLLYSERDLECNLA
ncbi:MAG: hypothetical protein JW727_05860 [Candidatus Aenigmarchaeota archaeon]|nr:hypothetical protein [Candidatus Aenigmarchaeota archaeon]